MTPSQATRFHQEKWDLDLTRMANSAINPSAKAVYYAHEVWLFKNHGTIGGNSMFQSIEDYARRNPKSNIVIEVRGHYCTTRYPKCVKALLKDSILVYFLCLLLQRTICDFSV